jgi:hypothetical protein
LLGNGSENSHSWQQKTLFSVESVLRSYKRTQSEDEAEHITGVESSRVESSELASAELVRKESHGAKKTS